MRRRFAARSVLLVGALVLAAVWAAGCADNPSTSVLEPPGGQGGVIGRVVFPGVTGTLPEARITPIIAGASPCSGFGAIAVLGTMNGFNTAEAPNYAMRQIAACEWVIELQFEEGPADMKLVTGPDINSVAFDSPGDYGKLGANNNDDPLEGTLDNPANGSDGNLSVTIPSTGLWTIYLNENTNPASYRITQDVLIPLSDPADGTFEIIGLPVGTISLVIEAEGYSPVTISNVDVAKNKVTDLGDITMDPIAGALTGTVAFSDNPSVPPTALIQVRNATTLSLVDTVSTTGAFSIEGLATGTYLLWIRADGYQNFRARNVDYVNGQNTDVGTKTLTPGCGSDYLTIQLAGEFTSWTLSELPSMTEGPGCVWTDTLQVDPGNYNFKFVTGGVFDNDYGSDETTLTLPGTYPVIAGVSGEGTAINVEVAAAGEYIFTLDEANLEFTASFVGEIPSGSISGTVGFSDVASPPLPEATVRVLRAGTTNEVASTTTSTQTGAFSFDEIVEGTYDISISADGYLPRVLANETVTVNQNTDLGSTVLQVAETTLHGTVAFSDAPSTPPQATVQVRNAATNALVASRTTTGAFSFEGLVDGTYFLWVRADGYQNARVPDIAYMDGVDYDAGTVTLDPGCGSDFLTIQLAGEVTSWTLTEAPFMVEGPGCVWTADTVQVEPGTYNMKFVTDGNFDSPGDYGGDEVTVSLPGTYPVIAGVSGQGTAISVEVSTAGEYIFSLDEENLEFTALFLGDLPTGTIGGQVAFEGVSAAPYPVATVRLLKAGTGTEVTSATTTATDRSFQFTEVLEGTYDVRITATGYLPKLIEDVQVVDGQDTPLGSNLLSVAVTSLHGSVSFSDAPGTLPEATVQVRNAATYALVESATTADAFSFEGLDTGSYFLWIRADGYQNARVIDIEYTSGVDYDAGTVTMDPGCGSSFLTIQLAGELTSWDLNQAPFMIESPGCVWTDTVDATAGTYYMKFVTDRAFDNPRDFGGDESPITLPGTFPVDPNASGAGSALRVVLPADGQWVFTLDEENVQFTAVLLGAQIDGAITGAVAFAGITEAPYPPATVSLFRTGETTALRTGTTDTETGAFTFNTVADGTYDLSFAASCFATETRTSVTVAGDTQDVGTVNLAEGGSSFTTIQVAGEFTSWNLAEAPFMTPGAACTWADTLDIIPGTYNFKFVTDGTFDNPGDYGGDQVELTLPGTYGVIAGVSGEGTAIRVTVDTEATYIITLNERIQEFSVETLSAAPAPRSHPSGN